MGYLLLGATINVIEYWILIFIMQYIFSAHLNLSRKNIIICTVFTGICYFVMYLSIKGYADYSMPILIALTVLCFSVRKIHDLLLFFPAVAFYTILTVIPESLLYELFPTMEGTFVLSGQTVKIAALVSDVALLLFLILLRYISNKYETKIHLNKKDIWGCIGLLFFLLIDVMLLMTINRAEIEPHHYYIWKFIFVAAFFISIGYYLYHLIDSRIRVYRQSISRNEMEYLRIQLDSLQDVKENEEQVKHLRHDLQNHLAIIQSLCEDGNYEEIKDYTANLSNNIVLTGHTILTGNNVADLVVNSKSKVATAHEIAFTFTGSLKHLSSMEAPDICGLLANAYDNAIEACLSQENAYIHTKVTATQNYTVIQITNSIPHKIPIRSNRIVTTKKDKQRHGYGISIMERIAQKYNGRCTLHSSDKELTVKIVLLADSIAT